MLQHYSVSWKKGLTALCLLAVAGLSGCDQKENAAAKVEYDGLSNSQPLRVDANNHTVTMLVQINGRFLTDDTRHGICLKMAPTDINRCLWVMRPRKHFMKP